MPLKVLIIHHSSNLDGSFISLFNLLQVLPKDKVKPIVILPKRGPAYDKLKEIKIKTKIIPQGHLVYNTSEKITLFNPFALTKILPALNLFNFFRLRHLIKKEKINLVHLNSSSLIFSALAIKIFRIPLVWHIRERIPKGILSPFLVFLIKNSAKKIIAVSEDEAQPFQKSKKLTIIYNPVDTKYFEKIKKEDKEKIKKNLGFPLSSPLLGFIGRIHKTSGIFDLVRAIKIIKKEIPQIKIVIVGRIFSPKEIKKQRLKLFFKKILFLTKGQLEYYLEMKRLIKKNNLESNFIFLGFQKDIAPIIWALDLILCPTHLNVPGRLPLEAAFLGKPVILAHKEKKSKILLDGKTGIIIPPKRPKLLAKAVIDLIKNKEKREKMGREAEKRAKKLFSDKKISQDILKIYQEAIKHQNG